MEYDLMLQTVPIEFDFHWPKGGRDAFSCFTDRLSDNFGVSVGRFPDPIFSYGVSGIEILVELLHNPSAEPSIVYLSNIVMHSPVLIRGLPRYDSSGGTCVYNSVDSFLSSPTVRGFHADNASLTATARAAIDSPFSVISNLMSAVFWSEDALDGTLFRVDRQVGSGYAGRILDYDRYFRHAGDLEEVTYFIPPEETLDLKVCLARYDKEKLTSYLQKRGRVFATLGDCHMDDSIVVSYGRDLWGLPPQDIAFFR